MQITIGNLRCLEPYDRGFSLVKLGNNTCLPGWSVKLSGLTPGKEPGNSKVLSGNQCGRWCYQPKKNHSCHALVPHEFLICLPLNQKTNWSNGKLIWNDKEFEQLPDFSCKTLFHKLTEVLLRKYRRDGRIINSLLWIMDWSKHWCLLRPWGERLWILLLRSTDWADITWTTDEP